MRSVAVRAVLILLASIVLMEGMGAFVKILLVRYHAPELSVYRNLIGMVPGVILLMATGELRFSPRKLKIRQWRLALLRGVFVAFAQVLYYQSLIYLDFAIASALAYTMALFLVAYSVPLLGEKVGLVRWLAVLAGFAGAIWIVRPGSDVFTLASLLPLAAAALYAASSVTARLIDRSVPNALIYLYSATTAACVAVLFALGTSGFTPIASLTDMAMICAMGLLGGLGVLGLLLSVRMITPSVLAPFNYFGIPVAFVIGWIAFGEAPIDRLFPGVLLIVAGGLLVIWRERRKA